MSGSKKDASPQTRAEIIAIGTEILLGDLVDTNSVYLAEKLKGLGINLLLKTVVGDNLKRLTTAVASAMSAPKSSSPRGGSVRPSLTSPGKPSPPSRASPWCTARSSWIRSRASSRAAGSP